jgi:Do/DeqQ family serine protease
MPFPRAALAFILASTILDAAPAPDSSPVPSSATTSPNASVEAASSLLHQIDDAFVTLFENVSPAVVIIEAEKKPSGEDQEQSFDFFFHTPEGGEGSHAHPSEGSVRSEGSGFIIRHDGYIYTNYHVVEDATKIMVKLKDRRHFIATMVGADERTDIAVLKIDASGLPSVPLADSDNVRVGQVCFAIGIPYNLDFSLCRGIVSAKGRGNLTSTPTKPMYEDYIQTDAFINPGNSGGPLFDVDGRVIGMNTLINGVGRGLAFAIPANMLSDVGGELIAHGKVSHPWLGITVSTLDEEEGAGGRFKDLDSGVCVDTIEANAPAFKSDLRPFDVIMKVDSVPVLTAHDLQREILRKKVGQSVDISVWRDGKSFDIAITTEELPADLTKLAANHSKAKTIFYQMYGLELAPPPAAGQDQPVDNKGTDAGVRVNGVLPDTAGSKAGVQVGDIITAVEDKPVANAPACLDLLNAAKGHPHTTLTIVRQGQKSRAVLDTSTGNGQ